MEKDNKAQGIGEDLSWPLTENKDAEALLFLNTVGLEFGSSLRNSFRSSINSSGPK
jgi:hypothetical protein